MAVNLKCPNLKCRQVLKVPSSSRGKRVRCVFCGRILMVPEKKSAPRQSARVHSEDSAS